MDSVMTHLQAALAMGEEIVDRNPNFCLTKYMRQMEKSYGGSRASWFLGLFTCVSVLLYVIGGMALIANLIGFCYPAVASFKAIDSPDALLSQQWLSYWVIYGAFFTTENGFGFVVDAIPYYNLAKGAVLIYCFHPKTKGATLLYKTLIQPFVVQRIMPESLLSKKAASASATLSGLASSAAAGFSNAQAAVSRGAPSVTVPGVADLVSPDLSELRSALSDGESVPIFPSEVILVQFVELNVIVVSASDVVPTEAPGAGVDCDPYCVLEVLPEGSRPKQGAAENTKYKTVCKTGTANPVWNEGVTIPQVEHMDAKLVVTVCNKRAMGRDQCLGKIEVPLERVKGAPEPSDLVMSLQPSDDAIGPACGDLRVTVQLK